MRPTSISPQSSTNSGSTPPFRPTCLPTQPPPPTNTQTAASTPPTFRSSLSTRPGQWILTKLWALPCLTTNAIACTTPLPTPRPSSPPVAPSTPNRSAAAKASTFPTKPSGFTRPRCPKTRPVFSPTPPAPPSCGPLTLTPPAPGPTTPLPGPPCAPGPASPTRKPKPPTTLAPSTPPSPTCLRWGNSSKPVPPARMPSP